MDPFPWWSFTIVVTDNKTGESYDYTLEFDGVIPSSDLLAKDFLNGFYRAALYFSERTGICPGKEN